MPTVENGHGHSIVERSIPAVSASWTAQRGINAQTESVQLPRTFI
jgi:hypothetical protein